MFTIDILTLFPEVFAPFIGLSIIGRAVESGKINIHYHHLLDALKSNERADEPPYGGGPGMVMRIEPIARILDKILKEQKTQNSLIVVPTPSGKQFKQPDATRFSKLDRLIIICGHYEGIDDRLPQLYPIEEYSLGDFVLTGGEIPTLAIMDATVRQIDGVVNPDSLKSESYATAQDLDYPAYTRPPVFRGVSVPAVLLSGDHAQIAEWRRQQSRERTIARREESSAREGGASGDSSGSF